MSLLTQVLSSKENVELEHLNKKVPDIIAEISNFKCEVTNFIENVYVKFKQRPKVNMELSKKAMQLSDELEAVNKSIIQLKKKDISNAANVITNFALELEATNVSYHFSADTLKIHEALLAIKNMINSNLFVKAAKDFNFVNNCFDRIPEDEYTKVMEKLQITVIIERGALQKKMSNIFFDNFIMDSNEVDNVLINSIKLKTQNDEMEQVLLAFLVMDSSISLLNTFCKMFWDWICVPIINNDAKIVVSEEDCYYEFLIEIKKSQKCSYKDVFQKLHEAMRFLYDHVNYALNDQQTVLDYIGNYIRSDLVEMLIKNCLADTIPSTSEGLVKYKQVIGDVEQFQQQMVQYHIFDTSTKSILDYANSVDVLFINKKCREYLNAAITLMKKDLHDHVEVGVPYDVKNPFKEEVANEFPQFSVSRSTTELLYLGEEILELCIGGTEVCAGRLLCTVQNIFYLYGNIVTEHHQKLLQTIPQQVALFHNNCLYIAHKLKDWNATYKEKLASTISSTPPSFKDQAYQLRKLGQKTFHNYVQEQIEQIEKIINESGLIKLRVSDKMDSSTEKLIRQCLRQQELLKTVWHKVLSYEVYNKTLGHILNSFCNNLIKSVLGVEDISSATAEQLVDIYKVVITRAPKLFSDPNEINLYVESWYKLNELIFILSSSLIDIDERWTDGKGPLALQFKPDDVKGLIRALFQNTDRRAAVLAKIHE